MQHPKTSLLAQETCHGVLEELTSQPRSCSGSQSGEASRLQLCVGDTQMYSMSLRLVVSSQCVVLVPTAAFPVQIDNKALHLWPQFLPFSSQNSCCTCNTTMETPPRTHALSWGWGLLQANVTCALLIKNKRCTGLWRFERSDELGELFFPLPVGAVGDRKGIGVSLPLSPLPDRRLLPYA